MGDKSDVFVTTLDDPYFAVTTGDGENVYTSAAGDQNFAVILEDDDDDVSITT